MLETLKTCAETALTLKTLMTTIYKYPLSLRPVEQLEMHGLGQILKVGLDPEGNPSLWAKVDSNAEKCICTVYSVWTGREIPLGANNFIGTFSTGPLVWHIFIE